MLNGRLTLVCILIFVIWTAPANAQVPPVAALRPVSDDYHGTKIADPYRYMEDLASAEVQTWMKAQADYAFWVLQRIPGRNALLERIRKIEGSTAPRISDIKRLPNGRLFYQKLPADEDVFKLYMRESTKAPEKLLVDPDTFRKETGKPHAVNYWAPSHDGTHLVYGVSAVGSEDATMRIMETANAKHVDRPIDRTQFGIVFWLEDGSGFFYWRSQKLAPDAPPILKYVNSKAYLHRLGTDPEMDEVVLGAGVQGIEIKPTEFPAVGTGPGCPYALGVITTGVSPEFSSIYIVPLSQLKGVHTPWKKIADRRDLVSNLAAHGDDLFVLTFKDALRFKVTRVRISEPDFSKAETIIPAGEAVVKNLSTARDALYAELLDEGVKRVVRVPYGPNPRVERINLPPGSSGTLTGTHPLVDGTFLIADSWTCAPRIYEYRPRADRVVDAGLQPRGRYDKPGDLVHTEVKVRSHDGVSVPLSIVHRKGIRFDGRNPTLLEGYGAYGISMEPRFDANTLAWLERGGVSAVAHVRGGGEFGEEWHRAGFKATKPNTWKDFIACAEYLIRSKYTSPRYLAGTGASAGGILIGRAMTERPDLFGVAILRVGALDTLRSETTPNGVPNIPEFGTVKLPEEFKALYEMSSYHHVRNDESYPAVLLTHGMNDPRVEPWQSAKMAARLQAAGANGKPILLRLDYESGHGLGNTKGQTQEQFADILSFVLWQCGIEGFQP